MAAVDLYTKPGQAGLDPVLQRAFLTTWLLVVTSKFWIDPNVRLVYDDKGLQSVKDDGAASDDDILYIDMRDVYPRLAPMKKGAIDALIEHARESKPHQEIAAEFSKHGKTYCEWGDDYCLTMDKVLSPHS